jgi:hypothetical protein
MLEGALESTPQLPEALLVSFNEFSGVRALGGVNSLPSAPTRARRGKPHNIRKRQDIALNHVRANLTQEVNTFRDLQGPNTLLATCLIEEVAFLVTTNLHKTRCVRTIYSITALGNSSLDGKPTLDKLTPTLSSNLTARKDARIHKSPHDPITHVNTIWNLLSCCENFDEPFWQLPWAINRPSYLN